MHLTLAAQSRCPVWLGRALQAVAVAQASLLLRPILPSPVLSFAPGWRASSPCCALQALWLRHHEVSDTLLHEIGDESTKVKPVQLGTAPAALPCFSRAHISGSAVAQGPVVAVRCGHGALASCCSPPAPRCLQVWQFIVEREIESPERFQAIQSYRAAMAVLQQQMHYVEQMRDSGMLDESEELNMRKWVLGKLVYEMSTGVVVGPTAWWLGVVCAGTTWACLLPGTQTLWT